MEPLFQIVHLSDMHFASPKDRRQGVGLRARFHRLAQRFPWLKGTLDSLEEGLCGHDPEALTCLREALEAISGDMRWKERPRWLVVTGDQTTWGDISTAESVQRMLEGWAADFGYQLKVLYGNHDVWPGCHPVLSPPLSLTPHREAVRQSCFQDPFPTFDNLQAIPGEEAGQLKLCLVNSIRHERIENTLAQGRVTQDYYWRHRGGAGPQLQALSGSLGQKDIGIVACHHPVYDPNSYLFPSLRTMQLTNGQAVANHLNNMAPRIRLVLTGHTHKLNPEFGDCPSSFPIANPQQTPLSKDLLQLTVGTAAQAPYGEASDFTQDFQVLQFSHDPRDSELCMDRIVWRRSPGLGDFTPMRADPNDSQMIAEEVRLR